MQGPRGGRNGRELGYYENPCINSYIAGNKQDVYCPNNAQIVVKKMSCVMSRTACIQDGTDDKDHVVTTRVVVYINQYL